MNQSDVVHVRNASKHLCSNISEFVFADGFHMQQVLHEIFAAGFAHHVVKAA